MSSPIPRAPHEHLVWVTRTCALNPAHILEVFHGKGGHIEVYLFGRTRQLAEHELTDAGRALLVPHGFAAEPDEQHRADLTHAPLH